MKLVRLVILFAVFAIGGIFLLVSAIGDKIELSKPKGDLTMMTANDFYDGRFVEGTLYELWDEFAYMKTTKKTFGITTSSKVSAHYFAFPLETSYDSDEWVLAAISFSNDRDYALAKKIYDQTEKFYTTGKEPATWEKLQVVGKVTKLKGDGLKFFQEYIVDDCELSASRNMVPYVINFGNDGDNSTVSLIIGIVATIVGLGGLAFMIIRKISSRSY